MSFVFCKNCRSVTKSEDKYCRICGDSLEDAETAILKTPVLISSVKIAMRILANITSKEVFLKLQRVDQVLLKML